MRSMAVLAYTALLGFTAACGDNNGGDDTTTPDAPDTTPVPVTVKFAAQIGGTDFACGQDYPSIGSASSTFTAADFRFYITNLKLSGTSGDVDVTLDTDDFQNDGVALLDFEDGTSSCQNGDAGTHTAVTGTVPPGTYTGVSFTVGIPFEQNHLDVGTSTAPLNVPAMYWTWAGGHKFIRIDGTVGGNGFNLHLGSTGCTSTSMTDPPASPCANPNTMDISLSSFSAATDTIVLDPAPAFADVDVSQNTAATAPGCQSFPNDPECDLVFPHLGLAYGNTAAGTQVVFSVQ